MVLLTTLCERVVLLAGFKSLARGILAGFKSLLRGILAGLKSLVRGILADLLKRIDGLALLGVPPIIPAPPPSGVEQACLPRWFVLERKRLGE